MKPFLIAGAIALGVCCLLGIFFGGLAFNAGQKINQDGAEFASRVVPEILGTWDSAKLLEYGADELRTNNPPEEAAAAFEELEERLGAFRSMGKPAFRNINAESNSSEGTTTVLEFEVPCTFAKGSSTLNLKLVRREGDKDWTIGNFTFPP